jgi:hypothetical protein
MSAWRDISTAPKDGGYAIRVDLWVVAPKRGGEEQLAWRETDCYWHPKSAVPRWCSGDGDTVEDDGNRATHWMPVPAPPSPEGA